MSSPASDRLKMPTSGTLEHLLGSKNVFGALLGFLGTCVASRRRKYRCSGARCLRSFRTTLPEMAGSSMAHARTAHEDVIRVQDADSESSSNPALVLVHVDLDELGWSGSYEAHMKRRGAITAFAPARAAASPRPYANGQHRTTATAWQCWW